MFDHSTYLAETTEALIAYLPEQMPLCTYRDFYRWAFSQQNPAQEEWLQTTGLAQLVVLTTKLYQGLVTDDELQQLVTLSIPVNIYQVYEIVSDNIGIGLGLRAPDDTTFAQRRQLISTFNAEMTQRLQNDAPDRSVKSSLVGGKQLAPLRRIGQISGFTQSLSSDKHYATAQAYLQTRPDLTLADVEYALWPMLIANMESAVDTLDAMQGYDVGPMVREGLIRRYQAVNRLLNDEPMTFEQRVEVSTHAILVVPIFAYYIGILCEKVRPLPNWERVIQDNSLYEALYLAALMIRLLNDLGTNLIKQTVAERAKFMTALADEARRQDSPTLPTVLSALVEQHETMLTRLNKDLRHGEFNLGFSDLIDSASVAEALTAFDQRLADCAALYEKSDYELTERLSQISATLGDNVTSTIIKRIVKFHEVLYAQSYRQASGEYAV